MNYKYVLPRLKRKEKSKRRKQSQFYNLDRHLFQIRIKFTIFKVFRVRATSKYKMNSIGCTEN